jgi:hypothetical protein
MHRHLRRTTPPDFGVKLEPSHGADGGQPDDPIVRFFPWHALGRDHKAQRETVLDRRLGQVQPICTQATAYRRPREQAIAMSEPVVWQCVICMAT